MATKTTTTTPAKSSPTVTPVNNYNRLTGAKLNTGESYTYNGQIITQGTPVTAGQSTTTLSTGNIPGKIATNNTNLGSLGTKGVTTDTTTGTSTNADGTVNNGYTYMGQDGNYYNSVTNAKVAQKADTTPEDTQINSYWDQMKSNTDAITASMIGNIQSRYSGYKQAQQEINKSQLAGTTNALLMSGAAQHDVYSQDAINYRINLGNQAIRDLEAKENEEIAQAKQLQMEGNQKMLESKLSDVQATRKAKIDAVQKLNDSIIEATQKTQETAKQIKIDNAIADLYSQGIIDTSTIMAKLKLLGIDATAEQVAGTLKNIEANLTQFEKMKKDVLDSAQTAKDYQSAGKILALDTKSPTFAQDLAKLQGEIEVKAKAKVIASNKKAIIAEGEKQLNASKGTDGWVDPYVYKQAYEDWVKEGIGTAKEFLAAFPPKLYINPEASNLTIDGKPLLPTYLQNNPTKTSTTTTNRKVIPQ